MPIEFLNVFAGFSHRAARGASVARDASSKKRNTQRCVLIDALQKRYLECEASTRPRLFAVPRRFRKKFEEALIGIAAQLAAPPHVAPGKFVLLRHEIGQGSIEIGAGKVGL